MFILDFKTNKSTNKKNNINNPIRRIQKQSHITAATSCLAFVFHPIEKQPA